MCEWTTFLLRTKAVNEEEVSEPFAEKSEWWPLRFEHINFLKTRLTTGQPAGQPEEKVDISWGPRRNTQTFLVQSNGPASTGPRPEQPFHVCAPFPPLFMMLMKHQHSFSARTYAES